MRTLRLRDVAMFVVSGGMVVIGSLGLVGAIAKSSVLIAVLLATMVTVAFLAGRQSMRLNRS